MGGKKKGNVSFLSFELQVVIPPPPLGSGPLHLRLEWRSPLDYAASLQAAADRPSLRFGTIHHAPGRGEPSSLPRFIRAAQLPFLDSLPHPQPFPQVSHQGRAAAKPCTSGIWACTHPTQYPCTQNTFVFE